MIRLVDLGMQRDGRWLLRDVSLQLRAGQIAGCIGPPEAGKSMLLKALAGLQPIDAGTVDYGQAGQAAPEVGFAFQNNALFDELSVFDNVALPLQRRGLGAAEVARRVGARLRDVELEAAAAQLPRALSGGMQKRLGLARATIAEPQLGLFDEPTAGLDPQTAGRIMELLEALTERLQMATLIVSNDLPAMLPYCRQVLFLHAGRQLFWGEIPALLAAATPVVRQFVRGDPHGPL